MSQMDEMSDVIEALKLTDATLRTNLDRVSQLSPFFENTLIALTSHMSLESIRDLVLQFTSGLNDAELTLAYGTFLGTAPGDLTGRLLALRNREMLRIIYRDLSRFADLEETTRELSCLASFCINSALDDCYTQTCRRYGVPRGPDGEPEKMVVLAMGKLGAFELNLSSDVDLIFFYANQGEVAGSEAASDTARVITHQEFFLKVARQTIAILDNAEKIGSVFRVDMRLRPYGDSGPLVLHRAAMEKYYVEQGRDWERYAFIKARAIAGDIGAGEDFLTWLSPFIYRRHLDYGAVQSLREMKGLINKQVELKDLNDDLKLGPGGIREVEFVAQMHQLIWGGQHSLLRDARLVPVLGQIGEMGLLPLDQIDALIRAYVFLRNSEHAVQGEFDRQTHVLPETDDSRNRLAVAMGYPDFESYLLELNIHRRAVSNCFDALMRANHAEALIETDSSWSAMWQGQDVGAAREFNNEQVVVHVLGALKTDIVAMQLQDIAQMRIDRVIPVMLMLASKEEHCDAAIDGLVRIVRAVLRRSTYLAYLIENVDALTRLTSLVARSSWVTDQIIAFPILLYELNDRRIRQLSVARKALDGELREVLRTLDQGDAEAQMDTLRQFKLATTLKIAELELLGDISVMEASDALTSLAETLLEASVEMAWTHLESKHGLPCDESEQPLDERFAIIAYGKTGGLELAYGSDLDLTFLCNDNLKGVTDGPTVINNNVFYLRVAQRVNHILTSRTRFGALYTTDFRLRPQGNKGRLVATLNAFEKYQNNDAWTFEHQALVRARFVAGDSRLGQGFDFIRQKVILAERDRQVLLSEVVAMRNKMRANLSQNTSGGQLQDLKSQGGFDLKHDPGAIVDIEFMVQYAVLGWAKTHASLSRWTDVMRLLDELGRLEVMKDDDVETLQKAYLAFRAATHDQWLGLIIDYPRLQHYREDVHRLWNEQMQTAS